MNYRSSKDKKEKNKEKKKVNSLDNGACDGLDEFANAGATKLLDNPWLVEVVVVVAITECIGVAVDMCMSIGLGEE